MIFCINFRLRLFGNIYKNMRVLVLMEIYFKNDVLMIVSVLNITLSTFFLRIIIKLLILKPSQSI